MSRHAVKFNKTTKYVCYIITKQLRNNLESRYIKESFRRSVQRNKDKKIPGLIDPVSMYGLEFISRRRHCHFYHLQG